MSENSIIVTWEEHFATGITFLDNQHKELISLTNSLYQACLSGDESVGVAFKEAMGKMVNYVRFHFSAELDLLRKIKYPAYKNHKSEHDYLIKQILNAAKEYDKGKKFVPHQFVRTLKDWVFSHIAFTDKLYSTYVAEQVQKGLLNTKDLVG